MERPGQYIGDEYNSIVKDWEAAGVKMVFLFPDTYEIGMSHLGMRLLYEVVNNHSGHLMERSFVPLADMEARMRELGVPLFAWESRRAVRSFEVVGFTLQYELNYTNILNMLDLSGIPLLSADRTDDDPLIIAGGPVAYNPEPLADFIDLFAIGEAEDMLPELLDLYGEIKKVGGSKKEFLKRAAALDGVYIPVFYQFSYHDDGTIAAVSNSEDALSVVTKRIVQDMDNAPFPTQWMLPHTRAVHDRMMLEIMRGCTRGCRFCQAGIIYRPSREKTLQKLMEQAREVAGGSGCDEMGLMSLSSADHGSIGTLVDGILDEYGGCGIGVSLPSLRVDAFSVGLADKVQKVRKTGLTLAPEAGSQRMRDVINKGLTEDEIIGAVSAAFSRGWNSIKLYFMIGLPNETDEDIIAITELVGKILAVGRRVRPSDSRKPLKITLGVATFVPKGHTPFQWRGQVEMSEVRRKQALLLERIRPMKAVTLNYHDSETSILEAAFARGDRRLGKVLLSAWEKGCRADGWREHFRWNLWQEAFAENNIDIKFFANRDFDMEEILPWDHISAGVNKEWLKAEYIRSTEGVLTADCRSGKCSGCGVCQNLGCKNIFTSADKNTAEF